MQEIKVLNHGFVKFVDQLGNDKRICDAARVSYQSHETDFDKTKNRKLIRYMLSHGHTSPFEQVEFVFHIKLPIFIARQMVRHRTASLNEVSGRYSQLKTEFYSPKLDRMQGQSEINKQGSDGKKIDDSVCHRATMEYEQDLLAYNYNNYIEAGISKEIARINLPLSVYTELYWKIDLHNLFHFLKLRLDSHAQYEIRVYAQAIAGIIKDKIPLAYEAFEDCILNARKFSAQEMSIIQDVFTRINTIDQEFNTIEYANLNQRERVEFFKKLNLEEFE